MKYKNGRATGQSSNRVRQTQADGGGPAAAATAVGVVGGEKCGQSHELIK